MRDEDSFDRRLADRLRAAAVPAGESGVEGLQAATVSGRTIRRRRRRLAVAAAVVTALAVPVAALSTVSALHGEGARTLEAGDRTRLVGTYEIQVPAQLGAGAAASGAWTMTLDADGTVGLAGPPGYRGVLSGSTFDVAGSTVRINVFVQDRCSAAPVGTYRWTDDTAGLHLTVVSDGCAFRRLVLAAGVWAPQG
jgi:hypothetical protein